MRIGYHVCACLSVSCAHMFLARSLVLSPPSPRCGALSSSPPCLCLYVLPCSYVAITSVCRPFQSRQLYRATLHSSALLPVLALVLLCPLHERIPPRPLEILVVSPLPALPVLVPSKVSPHTATALPASWVGVGHELVLCLK